MPTVTASLAQSRVIPMINHGGTTTIISSYSNGGVTLAGSTVIKMVKVPHGATIIDGWVHFDTAQALTMRCGQTRPFVSDVDSNRFFSRTASGLIRFEGGVPFVVSASAEGAQYVWINIRAPSQQISLTFSCSMMVQYIPSQQ